MTNCTRAAAVAALVLTAIGSAKVTEAQRAFSASEGELRDAQAYSQVYGVGVDEALERLELQLSVGDLAAELAAQEAEVYAGVWVEHRPNLRVMAAFTDEQAKHWIEAYTAGTPLAGRLEVRAAAHSLVQLEALQQAATRALRTAGVAVESGISVSRNEVDLRILNDPRQRRTALEAVARLPGPLAFWPVEELSRLNVDVHGGLTIKGCTSGFSVIEEDQLPGVTTAGHCRNSQSYGAVQLGFQQQLFGGSHDIQWHTSGCNRVTNRIKDGASSTRAITGRRVRAQQTQGMFVCKYGKTTGSTCGEIETTSFDVGGLIPNSAATFVRVDSVTNGQIAFSGDSGGPWYTGNLALGSHSGGTVTGLGFAFYMAIDFVDDLDVDLLTWSSSTPSTPSVSVSCSGAFWGSTQITCTANASGGNPPYTYKWTYSGSAQGWDTNGNPASAYFWSPGCPAGSTNYFTVTVTDRSCQRVTTSGPNVCL